MKIIFLDIDGVLNSDLFMGTDAFKESIRQYKNLLDVINNAPETHIDPAAVQLLNNLVEDTGAQVVLSSSWRMKFSVEEMNEILGRRDATFKIVAATPLSRHMSRSLRGLEVQEYLDELDEQPESFVILDDMDEFPKHRKYFIHTKERVGLTSEDIFRATAILNKER